MLEDPNPERRNRVFGSIHSAEELWAIADDQEFAMLYGQLNDFASWCARQGKGVDPPYKLLGLTIPLNGINSGFNNIHISLPWFALGWGLVLLVAFILRMPTTSLLILFLGGCGILFMLGTMLAWFENDKRGVCHQCGFPIPSDRNIKYENWRGEDKVHSKAGLCRSTDPPVGDRQPTNCEWILHRYEMAKTKRNQRWDTIKMHRVRGWFFKVYRDPISLVEYTKADKKIPNDTAEEDMDSKAIMYFQLGMNLLQRKRDKQRFSLIKGNFTKRKQHEPR